ncbi:hypothetical protein P8452_52384 [Trifolium repens]|nr:hypothetical protein P8452_52384 [Trifolium repens]
MFSDRMHGVLWGVNRQFQGGKIHATIRKKLLEIFKHKVSEDHLHPRTTVPEIKQRNSNLYLFSCSRRRISIYIRVAVIEKKRRRCSISSLIAVADEGCLPEAEVIVCCHVGEVLSGGYNAL